jgi:spermidine/putrescine-binding protein
MLRKTKLGMASIFLIGILVALAFAGAAEEWTIKESLDVTVYNTETEIMDPTHTDKKFNRKFEIHNGENEIVVTAWGSNDEVNWEVMATKTISPNNGEWLILGQNHFWNVKLTGRTTGPIDGTSVVDAYLYYRLV